MENKPGNLKYGARTGVSAMKTLQTLFPQWEQYSSWGKASRGPCDPRIIRSTSNKLKWRLDPTFIFRVRAGKIPLEIKILKLCVLKLG